MNQASSKSRSKALSFHTIIYLFIYGLPNNEVSSSGHITSNVQMLGE